MYVILIGTSLDHIERAMIWCTVKFGAPYPAPGYRWWLHAGNKGTEIFFQHEEDAMWYSLAFDSDNEIVRV